MFNSRKKKKTVEQVVISATPVGFLRVRSEPNLGGSEVGRVNPGDVFELLEESEGWYKIKLEDGEGWISGQYAQKQEGESLESENTATESATTE